MVRNLIKILIFFYSRVIAGREDVYFNHAIFDLTESSDNQNILYFENIGMNRNKIYGLDDPENNSDAANKKYVDSENAKRDIATADKTSKSYVDSEIQNRTLLLLIKLANLTLTVKWQKYP